jgi:hypothetical protein
VTRPQYGTWRPDVDLEGAAVLDLPVLPARAAAQAVLGLDDGAALCALAGDEGVARWLLDATAALVARASRTRWEALSDATDYTPAPGESVIVEAGLPGLVAFAERAGDRVIAVEMSFPVTVTAEVRGALEAAR